MQDFLCCVLSVLDSLLMPKFFLCLVAVEAESGGWWCYCEPETCQYQNRLSKERCVCRSSLIPFACVATF